MFYNRRGDDDNAILKHTRLIYFKIQAYLERKDYFTKLYFIAFFANQINQFWIY